MATLLLNISFDSGVRPEHFPISRERVRRLLRAGLPADCITARLSLHMVGLRASEALNTDYRKRKKPTNILTFPYQGPPELHADLVLCLPLCRAEANAQGKPLDHHLAHLLVHGVLHACGLDHVQAPEAAQMEALETSILKRFRIPDPYQLAAQHETVAP